MKHVFQQAYSVRRSDRNSKNGHDSTLVWLTGLSGSGKSTIANAVEKRLFEKNCQVYTLDGDNIRSGLNEGLGFSPQEREENLRRIGEVAKLFVDSGTITIAAFVSPLQINRTLVRNIVGHNNFIEIFVNASIEVCEKRDVKGLYAKARSGEIFNFTGVSAPYETPANPYLNLDTRELSVDECADKIIDLLIQKKIIRCDE